MDKERMELILKRHLKWLRNEDDGERADLSGAVLSGAVLSDAVLSDADLRGAVLRDADLRGAVLSGAVLSDAVLSDADLRGAVLRDADLSDAVLRDAVLSDADLRGAVLRDADLSDADLRGAVLSGAVLRGAVLSGADLSGAVLRDAEGIDSHGKPIELTPEDYKGIAARYRERHPEIPVVPQLDSTVCNLVDSGQGTLDMSDWHHCETTHCRAGWAIHLAGDAGYALEAKIGSELAGGRIYKASTGRWPDFFASNESALEDICKWGKLEAAV
jgi:hypothetical protein